MCNKSAKSVREGGLLFFVPVYQPDTRYTRNEKSRIFNHFHKEVASCVLPRKACA